MARICSACGAENRDSAKFCLTCAHQLVSLRPEPKTATQAPKSRSPKQSKKSRKSRARRRIDKLMPLIWGGLLLLSMLMLAAFVWQLKDFHQTAQTRHSGTGSPFPHSGEALRAPESEALERAEQALRQLELEAEARAVERARQPVFGPPAPDSDAANRSRSESTTARHPDPLPMDSGIIETVEPLYDLQQDEAADSPDALAAQALCTGLSMFARARCLQDACSKPELVNHPQCVDLRAKQQMLRSGAGDH